MRPVLLALLVCLSMVSVAAGQDWQRYENARFGYVLEVPPGFVGQGEPANGDGQVFDGGPGRELRAYGGFALGGFEREVLRRIELARDNGLAVTYEVVTPNWASYSGTRGGRIVYARAIAICGGDALAMFELTYPSAERSRFDPLIDRLVGAFRGTGGADC